MTPLPPASGRLKKRRPKPPPKKRPQRQRRPRLLSKKSRRKKSPRKLPLRHPPPISPSPPPSLLRRFLLRRALLHLAPFGPAARRKSSPNSRPRHRPQPKPAPARWTRKPRAVLAAFPAAVAPPRASPLNRASRQPKNPPHFPSLAQRRSVNRRNKSAANAFHTKANRAISYTATTKARRAQIKVHRQAAANAAAKSANAATTNAKKDKAAKVRPNLTTHPIASGAMAHHRKSAASHSRSAALFLSADQ